MSNFVHLHLHTEYSVVDGVLHIKDLLAKAKEDGQPAVALTDQSNIYALVKFYSSALKSGIKPIVGADLWLEQDDGDFYRITVLCQNDQGYKNLSHLISAAYISNQVTYKHQLIAVVKAEWLAEFSAGLIVLAGRESDVGIAVRSQLPNLVAQRVSWWQEHFPERFYLELVRTGREQEEDFIQAALVIAERYELPVVATNDVRFLTREDFELHEIRTCIAGGYVLIDPNRPKPYSEEQYFRTAAEMVELFADIPEAIENTVEIARRCSLELEFGTYYLPEYPIPDGLTQDEYFEQVCFAGLDERLEFLFSDLDAEAFAAKKAEYQDRLRFELKTIIDMGFPGYFLIVADFIQWAKDQLIPVGPGRGSGAGSLVAYVLKITDIDPITYDLLFERFLNPERISMPDFDVDFCMDRRDEVINYVAEKYGRNHVSQIITHGTMAAKAVIRDVGRVLSHPYGLVDGIARLIPGKPGTKLQGALDEVDELRDRHENDEEATDLINLGLRLEGTVRNVGRHAGGVVIGPRPLETFCPMFSEPDGVGVVTQLDKDDVETIGLVKFDFLGLRTLTIIDWALASINQGKTPEDPGFVDINSISLTDKKVFDLIKTGRTTGIFQLESTGMQDLIRRLQPDCFEDIVALVALFRPGPLESGMVDNFIARKHGREAVSYPDPQYQHELLQPILEPTYGIILYQEQVMQIAQTLSGYTLGGADMLRRAMGSKLPEEMAKQRSMFEEGARDNNIDGELAVRIFDLVEKFAGYGFNKSHSAAYALVSYQSAWLKTYYPSHFMAAQLSSDMDSTEKVVHLLLECQAMGLKVVAPDVNICEIKFKASDENTILYGLSALKGVGEAILEEIISDRSANGKFQDFFDFVSRTGKKANRRFLEALIKAGAFDSLHPNRNSLLASIPMAVAQAEQQQSDLASGQVDLFGSFAEEAELTPSLVDLPEMPVREKLRQEKSILGMYFTGHPISFYQEEIESYGLGNLQGLQPERFKKIMVTGIVEAVRTKPLASGNKIAFVTITDGKGRLDAVLGSAIFESVADWIKEEDLLFINGEVKEDKHLGIKIDAQQVLSLADMREQRARGIKIHLNSQQELSSLANRLNEEVSSYKDEYAGLPLVIEYQNAKALAQFKSNWQVKPEEELIQKLEELELEPVIVSR